jgi:hypothetical protein
VFSTRQLRDLKSGMLPRAVAERLKACAEFQRHSLPAVHAPWSPMQDGVHALAVLRAVIINFPRLPLKKASVEAIKRAKYNRTSQLCGAVNHTIIMPNPE